MSLRLQQIRRCEVIKNIKDLKKAISKKWCVSENKHYLELNIVELKELNKYFGLKDNDMDYRGMQ